MEMPTIMIWAHTITMMPPKRMANIHMTLPAPMAMKASMRMPDMVWSSVNTTHGTAAEIKKHY